MNPILLGGIPRSGTTLACYLLNQLPDVLALIEPLDMRGYLACQDKDDRERFVCEYAEETRARVRSGMPISTTVIDGEQTNTFDSGSGEADGRQANIQHQQTVIDRVLPEDFKLVIKHPNAFAALLPELLDTFEVFMHIRSPLSVLASWHSLDHVLRSGHAPMAERFDTALVGQLSAIEDDIDRQIALVNWYFDRFKRHLGDDRIIRYEDVVSSGGRSLVSIHPSAENLDEPLSLKNRNELYSHAYLREAGERLLRDGGAWRNFYSEHDIEEVMVP